MSEQGAVGEKVRTPAALAFASLAVPLSILSLPIVIYVGPFYGEELGLGLGAVGTVFLVVRTFDALMDIFIGRWSDRTQSRMGRRKPWVLFGAPALLVATILVSFPPSQPSLIYFAAAVSLYYIAWTLVQIPHLSWGQDLGGDEAGRRRMSAWREAGTVIGALLAGLLPLIVPNAPGVSTAAHAIWVLGIAASVLLVIALVACILAVPERKVLVSQAAHSDPLWSALKSGPVLAAVGAILLMNVAAGSYNAVILILIEKEFGLRGVFLPFVLVQYLVCLSVVPLAVLSARKAGTFMVLAGGVVVFAAGLLAVAWLPASRESMFVLALAAGIYVSTLLVLTPAYVAEFAEAENTVSGRDRMGEFMALYNLATKLGAAVGAGAGLILFDVLQHAGTELFSGFISPGRIVGCYLPIVIFAVSIIVLRLSQRGVAPRPAVLSAS